MGGNGNGPKSQVLYANRRWPRAKKSVGDTLGSAAMKVRQTDFCVYLSAILLFGLVLNAALGWWWADPAAALVMVPIVVKEGIDGIKARTCC
jgi:divalent metal cation (Fe/Co/Zn/Cd) transporter